MTVFCIRTLALSEKGEEEKKEPRTVLNCDDEMILQCEKRRPKMWRE